MTRKDYRDILFIGALIVVCAFGLRAIRQHRASTAAAPQNVVAQVTPEAKVVIVPGPITDKTVTQYLSDPADKAQIAALLKENATYRTTVESLTSTTGTLTTERVLTATTTPPTAANTVTPSSPEPTHVSFKDWHIEILVDGAQAQYKLQQRFVVLSTTGRSSSGQPLSLTKMYEIGAGGERIPVTGLQTEAVYTDQTQPHFFVHQNVQGGLVASIDGFKGGLIGLQWLKRGRTNAPEDVSFAFLTPVYAFSPSHFGVLPISWNVGRRLKPLSNLWLSPYVNRTQVGGAVTATF